MKAKTNTPFSGKIGGIVGQQGRYGQMIRAKVSPVQPRTPPQLAARSRRSLGAQRWRNLTDPQRAAWNSFAAITPKPEVFGSASVLDGFNWFVSWNEDRQLLGLTIADTPPPTPTESPVIPEDIFVLADDSDQYCQAFAWATPHAQLIGLWYATPDIGSTLPKDTAFRIIALGPIDAAATDTIALATPNSPLRYLRPPMRTGLIFAQFNEDGLLIRTDRVTQQVQPA
jgi:hypothetical protein